MKHFLAIIIFISTLLVVPQMSSASFEKSFANVGSSLFSAIGASIDTATDVARATWQATKRQHQMLRRAENHLMSRGHQMLRSLPELMVSAIQSLQKQFASIKQGLKELGKVELVFIEKQETRSLASLPTSSKAAGMNNEPTSNVGSSVRYEKNSEGQTVKIIERIVVRESSNDPPAGPLRSEASEARQDGGKIQNSFNIGSLISGFENRLSNLITNVANLTSRADQGNVGGAYNNSALFNMIAQSQRIKTLDDVKITNATIEGYASSKSVSDSYLPLTGGTLTGGLTGTTLTLSGLSTLVGANLSGVLNASSTAHISGFTRLAEALFAAGPMNASSTAHFTATSTFGNLIRIEGTGTSTILGRLSISATSTIAGYKICTQENGVCVGGAFTSSGGFTTLRTASDLVGIGTSTPGEKLSVNGGVYFDSDIIRYGSSSASSLTIKYQSSATSTIRDLIKNSFSFATSTTVTPFLSFDTLNYRIGLGTTSPVATFSVKGSGFFMGGLGIGNATTTSGILETSGIAYFGGILKGASTFTFAGTGSSFLQGALGIATTTPAERFSLNGGAFFDSDIIRFGSSSAPTLNFRYFASSTSTIPNLTSAFTFATSTTNTPLLTLSTKSSRYGRVGIGTSSPSALFAINALNSSNQADNIFYIGSSTANILTVDNHGNVGIGATSPNNKLSVVGNSNTLIEVGSSGANTLDRGIRFTNQSGEIAGNIVMIPNTVGTDSLLQFYVGGNASGDIKMVINDGGNVGIGTTSPFSGLSLKGDGKFITLEGDQYATEGTSAKRTTIGTGGGSGERLIMNALDSAELWTVGVQRVTVTNAGNVTITGNCSDAAGGGGCTADYAEVMHRDARDDMEKGDLLALNPQTGKLVRADNNYSTLIGVYSSAPGTLIGQRANSIQLGVGKGVLDQLEPDEIPVALVGRVPVKVTTENGPIQIGDRITSSSLPGVGMKATKDGYTVGIALEPFDCATSDESHDCATSDEPQIGKILVFVNLGYSKLDDGIASLASGSLAMTNDSGWTIDQQTGRLTTTYGLDLGGNSIQNVSAIMSASGNWRIDENGKLVVKEIETENLNVKNKTTFGTPENPQGITIYDPDGMPYCIKIERGGTAASLPGECDVTTPEPSSSPTP